VIGDRQWITVLAIPEQELAFVIGAPELIGALPQRQGRALGATTHATAPIYQPAAIQKRMDGALGRDQNTGKSAD